MASNLPPQTEIEIEVVDSSPPETETTTGSSESQQRVTTTEPSLLSRLKCPRKSDLCRKRKVQTLKSPTAGKKQHKPGAVNPTDPKTVTATSRVKEFPGEYMTVKNNKLFCSAFREEIALKKSTIKNHLNSGGKHKKAKEELEKKHARERNIAEVLRAYDQEVPPTSSASVSMDARVYRVRVVEQFLKSGIPIAKIDCLRPILEEGSYRLTHCSHLSEYIPVIYAEEKKRIRSEIERHDHWEKCSDLL